MAGGKVALVTGSGTRRIGWHVADALAQRGYSLVLHYRNRQTGHLPLLHLRGNELVKQGQTWGLLRWRRSGLTDRGKDENCQAGGLQRAENSSHHLSLPLGCPRPPHLAMTPVKMQQMMFCI